MVHKTIRCFEEIDGVKNRLKTGRSAIATNPEKSLDVLQSFVEKFPFVEQFKNNIK